VHSRGKRIYLEDGENPYLNDGDDADDVQPRLLFPTPATPDADDRPAKKRHLSPPRAPMIPATPESVRRPAKAGRFAPHGRTVAMR
jgi:hypothetical protein